MRRPARIVALIALVLVALSPAIAAIAGKIIAPSILHPLRLNPERLEQPAQMLERTHATKQDFDVTAQDGMALRGWKIQPRDPNGDWVIVFHGVSDNRTGVLGHAEFLLRNGYSIVMMDARAHGKSGGEMCTYGWKERHDTVAVTNALYGTERVRHLFALGVSMGAAVALQSAAIEPRIEAVVAEDPFANLREVSYDYAGLDTWPLLGKTLFRPAVIVALHTIEQQGGFNPDDVSPEKAVAERPFAVLLICDTRDHRIPCRHAKRIYAAARGAKQLWIVHGAGHAAALGYAPAEYERRVVELFASAAKNQARENRLDAAIRVVRVRTKLMNDEANELLNRALSLPAGEGAELAGSLIESLDTTEDEAVKIEWDREIARRMEELDTGAVRTISFEEVRQRLNCAIE